MARAQKRLSFLLLCYAVSHVNVWGAKESSLTACSSDNTACTYQHELWCPQHSTVSVVGGGQRFDSGVWHCIGQGFTCSHGCCTGCTIAMTSEKSSSLRQQCDGRQNCSASVNRTFVTCGVFKKDDFYSDKSIVEYQCVQTQDTSMPSTSVSAQHTHLSSHNTDVTKEAHTSTSDVITAVASPSPPIRTWSNPSMTSTLHQDGVTEGWDKGGHFSQTAASPTNLGAVVGGAVAGAVTLLALPVALFLCWRRRRRETETKIESADVETTDNAYEIMDVQSSFARRNASHPKSSAFKDMHVTSSDQTYTNARRSGTVDDVTKVYANAEYSNAQNDASNLYENARRGGKQNDVSNSNVNPGDNFTESDVSRTYEGLDSATREDVSALGLYQELGTARGSAGSKGAPKNRGHRGRHGNDVVTGQTGHSHPN